jgi:hypothetical protein
LYDAAFARLVRLKGEAARAAITGVTLLGGFASPAFALLHGAGNGVLTIAKGALPLALFGARGDGERQGWIMAPSRVAQALAPLAFGACVARWGVQAMGLSAGLSLSAWLVLARLRSAVTSPGPPR